MTVTAVLRMSPAPAHALSLLPLETVYRILQCVGASCDWLLTSVEALPHSDVTLVLPLSPCMYARQSAVPGQVTGGPTAATRGSQPPTQV